MKVSPSCRAIFAQTRGRTVFMGRLVVAKVHPSPPVPRPPFARFAAVWGGQWDRPARFHCGAWVEAKAKAKQEKPSSRLECCHSGKGTAPPCQSAVIPSYATLSIRHPCPPTPSSDTFRSRISHHPHHAFNLSCRDTPRRLVLPRSPDIPIQVE